MKDIALLRRVLVLLTAFGLLLTTTGAVDVFAQARRQPPVTNEKKNKRPDPNAPVEKQEPLPPDVLNRPQEAEKVTVSTAVVNVDAVVYHKKSGQIVPGLKQAN